MGIRFACHGCSKPLNIKNELAGRRGVCPKCKVRFRIPLANAEFSSPLEEPKVSDRVVDRSAADDSATQDATAGPRETLSAETGSSSSSPQATLPSRRPTVSTEPRPAAENLAADVIDLLGGDASATWYVRPPSGGQYGPADAEVLWAWISEGRVAKTALLWRDGWPQWREASEALPELAAKLPGGNPAASDVAFSEPAGAGKPAAPIATVQPDRSKTELSGDGKIGAVRRKRTARRITLVGVLAALVVGLIVTLFLVAASRGSQLP